MRLSLGEHVSRARATAGSSALYFSTIIASQLTSLLLLPILTRYLGPEAFGEYSLVLAVTGLLGTFGSVWVRNVGMRLYFDHVADGRTRTFFWTAAMLQAASMAAVLLLAYPVVRLAGTAVPPMLYASAGASVIVTDFYSLGLNTLRAGHRPVSFGVAEWTNSLGRLAITWAGLAAGYRTATMLFVCVTAGMLLASAVAAHGLRDLLVGRGGLDRSMARELVVLGIPSIPGSFGGWLISLSDRVLIAYFLDVRAVGIYSAAYGVADRAVNGLASGLYMSAGPAILRRWAEAGEDAAETIASYLALYVSLSVGPCVLLVLQREFVLRLLAGTEFGAAAAVVPWVVAGTWLGGAATYLNRPLELSKRFATLSGLATASAVVNVLLNLALIPTFGVTGAAAGTCGAFVGLALFSRYLAGQSLVIPLPWRAIVRALVATLVAAGASTLFASPWLAITAFSAIYVGVMAMLWLRDPRFSDSTMTLRRQNEKARVEPDTDARR
ncbi:MAG: polysaccharide biosynthesis protein [Acidobacteria bacterium]|nr:polysaccharide biosynthesis protein [Acidobacteriota bacterium]